MVSGVAGCRGCREDDGKESVPVIFRPVRALEFKRVPEKVRESAIGGDFRDPSAVCCVSVHTNTGEGTKPAMIGRRDTQTAGCPEGAIPPVRVPQKGTRGDPKRQNTGETTPRSRLAHTFKDRVFRVFRCFWYFCNLGLLKITKVVILHRTSDGDFAVSPSTFLPSKAGSRGLFVSAYRRGNGVFGRSEEISDRFGRWCTGGRIRCTVNTSTQ